MAASFVNTVNYLFAANREMHFSAVTNVLKLIIRCGTGVNRQGAVELQWRYLVATFIESLVS